jgi:hypothetical protein
MTDQIIQRAHIRAKARRDFDAGRPRNAHGFNPGSAAIFDYLEEYDRLASQVSQFARTSKTRVDAAQVQA